MENRNYRTNSLERTLVNGIELGGHKYVRSVILECKNQILFPVFLIDFHSNHVVRTGKLDETAERERRNVVKAMTKPFRYDLEFDKNLPKEFQIDETVHMCT